VNARSHYLVRDKRDRSEAGRNEESQGGRHRCFRNMGKMKEKGRDGSSSPGE